MSHYFIAIGLSEKGKNILANWVTDSKSNLPFHKWVHRNDYHITLCFLGHLPPEKRDALMMDLPKRVTSCEPIPLTFSKIGTFGNERSPRILWLGVEESDPLRKLQQTVAECCKKLGLKVEDRKYTPHITIARKWTSDESFELLELGKDLIGFQWTVEEIILFQTNIEKIPKYEAIKTIPFSQHDTNDEVKYDTII